MNWIGRIILKSCFQTILMRYPPFLLSVAAPNQIPSPFLYNHLRQTDQLRSSQNRPRTQQPLPYIQTICIQFCPDQFEYYRSHCLSDRSLYCLSYLMSQIQLRAVEFHIHPSISDEALIHSVFRSPWSAFSA